MTTANRNEALAAAMSGMATAAAIAQDENKQGAEREPLKGGINSSKENESNRSGGLVSTTEEEAMYRQAEGMVAAYRQQQQAGTHKNAITLARQQALSRRQALQPQPLPLDEQQEEEEEDSDDESRLGEKRIGRRKIRIEYIEDKSRRHITFSKRKAGIMKKAYELSTLTGTQVLLLVASETGHVYTFATPKLQPLITKPEGKNLIQACLNAPDLTPDYPVSFLSASRVIL